MSDNLKLRPDAFIVMSQPRQTQHVSAKNNSTYTIELSDRRVHVTERASLLRAVAAAMKDRRLPTD